MSRALCSAFVSLIFTACSSSSGPPPALLDDGNSPNHTDGAGAAFPAADSPTAPSKVGGSVGIAPGKQVGYELIAVAPRSYRLRWTGDAAVTANGYREFYGSVWTTGTFMSVTPGCDNQTCPIEGGDYVSAIHAVAGGQRIDWDTYASTGWDGFSFTTDTEPVYLDVFVDGARRPDLVSFPGSPEGKPQSPPASPFSVTSAE